MLALCRSPSPRSRRSPAPSPSAAPGGPAAAVQMRIGARARVTVGGHGTGERGAGSSTRAASMVPSRSASSPRACTRRWMSGKTTTGRMTTNIEVFFADLRVVGDDDGLLEYLSSCLDPFRHVGGAIPSARRARIRRESHSKSSSVMHPDAKRVASAAHNRDARMPRTSILVCAS